MVKPKWTRVKGYESFDDKENVKKIMYVCLHICMYVCIHVYICV
jgi:hypothetical protein